MKNYRIFFLKISLLSILGMTAFYSYSQKIATLEVNLTKQTFGLEIPVSINLNDITHIPDSLLNLYEIKGEKRIATPFQIEQGYPRKLYWIVETKEMSIGRHLFELVQERVSQTPVIDATVNDGGLTIHDGKMNLLKYNFKTLYPPEGVDSAYKRSGFIHPLWSPHGQILTRINAPDHYHHYGIWNPWTKVHFEGDTVDFWYTKLKQGTVRFANFVSIENGSVFSGFGALHEHVVFKKDGSEKIALNELQQVRVFRPQSNKDSYVTDFDIQLNCAGESPFKILKYRYAGFGWRATEKWDKNNSMTLTSEGKTRKNADNSTARWCIIQGEIDNDYAGIVMMSYPTNYSFPEPLRIWPENVNGQGDVFANFCPTKEKDWLLKPRQNYFLKYRLLVFNGHMNKEMAESAWQYFAYPPKVTIKLENH